MAKKIVSRVTLTGAGDNTDISELARISRQYPFVEWGVLLSKNSMGRFPRFPDRQWLRKLYLLQIRDHNPGMYLSAHLCGQWVRDVCAGKWTFLRDLNPFIGVFDRVQLNFHMYVHELDRRQFVRGFSERTVAEAYIAAGRQFIFQMDDVNNDILSVAKDEGIDAVPLFDLSGGAGVLPESWPAANGYCGYAGGLSPENVQGQLEAIEHVAGDGPIWIDAETHVRSDNDKVFDLDRVCAFLDAVLPWIVDKAGYHGEAEQVSTS